MTDFFENLLNNGELQEKVAELKAENNQLKEDIQDIAKLLDIDVDDELNYGFIEFEVKELKAENERLKEENEKLNKMTGIFSARLCEKYRTTLQEIKAIAEEYLTDCQGFKCEVIEEIIQKITKAEEE